MERVEEEDCLMNFLDSGELIFGLQNDEAVAATTTSKEFIYYEDSSTISSNLPSSSSSTTNTNAKEVTTDRSRKKQKKEASSGTIKVRKDRLGDKIAALQQLVSPFGKSDAASVLHEALGYIRFLHDQIQVLSSPYLQRQPTTHATLQGTTYKVEESREVTRGLRSRGLCLVPVSCTKDVTNNNGADLWSSGMGRRNV